MQLKRLSNLNINKFEDKIHSRMAYLESITPFLIEKV